MEAGKKAATKTKSSLKCDNNFSTEKLLRSVCKIYYNVTISTEGRKFFIHFENKEITRFDRAVIHHLEGQNLNKLLKKMLTTKFID